MTRTLTISRLTKRFQSVEALKAVSLTLEAGRRAALLGHNGAGKSTMMKIILGLIPFDGGEVSVCGAAPGSAAARSQLAYLPENVAFHPALTGEEQGPDLGTLLPLIGRERAGFRLRLSAGA